MSRSNINGMGKVKIWEQSRGIYSEAMSTKSAIAMMKEHGCYLLERPRRLIWIEKIEQRTVVRDEVR